MGETGPQCWRRLPVAALEATSRKQDDPRSIISFICALFSFQEIEVRRTLQKVLGSTKLKVGAVIPTLI